MSEPVTQQNTGWEGESVEGGGHVMQTACGLLYNTVPLAGVGGVSLGVWLWANVLRRSDRRRVIVPWLSLTESGNRKEILKQNLCAVGNQGWINTVLAHGLKRVIEYGPSCFSVLQLICLFVYLTQTEDTYGTSSLWAFNAWVLVFKAHGNAFQASTKDFTPHLTRV